MNLTVDQLNLMIVSIGDRVKKVQANQALIMRLAIVAALSKQGQEVFQDMMNDAFSETEVIEEIKPEDLAKFGLQMGPPK